MKTRAMLNAERPSPLVVFAVAHADDAYHKKSCNPSHPLMSARFGKLLHDWADRQDTKGYDIVKLQTNSFHGSQGCWVAETLGVPSSQLLACQARGSLPHSGPAESWLYLCRLLIWAQLAVTTTHHCHHTPDRGHKDRTPVPHLNIRTTFPGIEISIIKIRWLWDRLIFIKGIQILIRLCLYWDSPKEPISIYRWSP